MNNLQPKMLREARAARPGKNIFLEILIFFAVFLVGSSLASIPTSIAMVPWLVQEIDKGIEEVGPGWVSLENIMNLMNRMPSWMSIVNLFSMGLLTLTAILFCRWLQKRRAATLGFRKSKAATEYLVGAAFGILTISMTVGISALTGAFTFSTARVSVPLLLLYLLGFGIQGMAEETLCRGYFLTSMARRNPVWAATLVSSLVFGLLHIANPGFGILPLVNIALIGASFGVYFLKRGNIWGVSAMHSFWNFFQGNVYGISVSGTGAGNGATPLVAASVPGKELWNGGAFGIEGSLPCTIVCVITLLLFLFVLPKKRDEYVSEAPKTEETR